MPQNSKNLSSGRRKVRLALLVLLAMAILAVTSVPLVVDPKIQEKLEATVAAHLDATRRAALFEEILELGAQAWMTGTDMDMFAPLRAKADLFEVADSQPRLI